MNEDISKVIKPLLGKKCCRVKVGSYKSLSLGFGEKTYHNDPRLNDDYYGEWEAGSFYCAWRIMRGGNILYGADDSVEYLEKLNADAIDMGKLISLEQLSDIDMRLKFDSGIVVDFFATVSDTDEYFHIFCPDHIYVELAAGGKWSIGESNKPFNRSEDTAK